ncbi:MAG TPA: acyl-[ACP]--phospholipid O-acyltransferase [Ghiorsea sp.]|nr:acyl-[ACP]--phospholipid O-acyltransferase [Ghiorsea sp.]HIP08003.1 acyl-[ACP]--phospholipid O-acyltransferase [Mariprofundaceae bacterium]
MRVVMFITKMLFKLMYRVRVTGLDNFKNSGERTLIIANHISFLDGMLLGLFLPREISFGIHGKYYNKWWFAPIKRTMPIFAVDHSDPMAMKTIIQHIKEGNKIVVFPEGRITNTGSLMKIYPGSAMIADKADAYVLPIRINGAQFSPFSRLKGLLRLRWFPQITLDILPAKKLEISDIRNSRERRKQGAIILEDMMRDMLFNTSNYKMRLWDKLLEAANTHGKKHEIIEDLERVPLTYSDVFTRAMVLQQLLPKSIKHGERVGLLLPNVNGCYITFFAMQARGAVPALLNFTMGESATTAALETATIQTVITSRKFVEAGELEHLIEVIEKKADVLYLEDLRDKLSLAHKLKGLFMAKFPIFGIHRLIKNIDSSDAAVVLFTSGSEGTPKGVVLSHENILANIEQINASIPFNTNDICLNALPFFHSFGLTAGSMLTTLNGIKTFFYPSPLHYKIIPEFAYDIDATIIFGTNVFLAAYAKHAHPYDFQTMKYAVAGAEKLQDETRDAWMYKFGIRIIEGYGATETTPVISVNTPMHYKAKSVGRMMPGMQFRLEHVPGISEGGRLFVNAPNVMKGYLMHNNPGVLLPPEDGWYDTGDIVSIDNEGFLNILGRAKRFAKIAGEMISLTAVEELCKHCWPEHDHIALAFPDAGKGEKVVLLSTLEKPVRKELISYAHEHGAPDMLVPKQYLFVSEVPLLGTGKIHYVAAQALAEKLLK